MPKYFINCNTQIPECTWIYVHSEDFTHKDTANTICLLNELDFQLYDIDKTEVKEIDQITYDLLYNLASNDDYDLYSRVANATIQNDSYHTNKLYFKGMTFYLTDIHRDRRIYQSLDELIHLSIETALVDYDGALIGGVDECFREDEEDDMIRHFDSVTGIEEE